VSRSSEVIDVVETPQLQLDSTSARSAAFVRLADHHLDASYRLARAILRDPSEAQDVTHDALVQAWRKWSTLRDQTLFEPWFDRILVNTCRNRLRHAARFDSHELFRESAIAPGDPFGQTDDRDLLGRALATLSPDHRVVVSLRYFVDLPVDEIAARLGVAQGTVHSRLHYALKRLQTVLQAADSRGTVR
jgi:RNA polymerase sigma-70 factor, ECF subfamily